MGRFAHLLTDIRHPSVVMLQEICEMRLLVHFREVSRRGCAAHLPGRRERLFLSWLLVPLADPGGGAFRAMPPPKG